MKIVNHQKAIRAHTEQMAKAKASYVDGPWNAEPDRVEWRSRSRGLVCLVTRNQVGAWCGYVGLPPGHAFHGKHWDDVPVDVHGGLTFSGFCSGHICHVPAKGEPEDVWWLGFDCAHAFDLIPAMSTFLTKDNHHELDTGHVYHTYRDLAYVKREVERLADQLVSLVEKVP